MCGCRPLLVLGHSQPPTCNLRTLRVKSFRAGQLSLRPNVSRDLVTEWITPPLGEYLLT